MSSPVETIDFEHIKRTIDGSLIYIFASRKFLEKEINEVPTELKNENLIEFLNLSLDCINKDESINKCTGFLNDFSYT